MAGNVSAEQRFTAAGPCPVCGGHDRLPRGQGQRCHGFLSDDGTYAHCSREEFAGPLLFEVGSGTYAHRLTGDCRCGQHHDVSPAPAATPVRAKGARARAVAYYDYRADDGTLLCQVVRYDPKGFSMRRPKVANPQNDRDDDWVENIDGVQRVLYRLPDLRAADVQQTVHIVEGEKDADALAGLGLVATCNAGGAGKWRPEYGAELRGRRVAILPDNDEAGRAHAEKVARALGGVAAEVRVVPLPGLPEKGDVSDWLDRGGCKDDLWRLVAEAPEWSPPLAQPRAMLPAMLTASALLALDLLDAKFAVEGLIPEGLTILAGPPKVGKSWLVLQVAVATCAGGKALSSFDASPGDVLYISLEDSRRRLRDRLDQLRAFDARLTGLDRLTLATEWPRLDDGGVSQVAIWLDLHPDARLVILDTFQRIRPPARAQASIYADDYAAIAELKQLADERGIAFVLIHHTRKAEAGDPLAMVSGTNGLVGAADAILVLKRTRGEADATLFVAGRDLDEQTLALRFAADSGLWSVVGDASGQNLSAQRQALLAALREASDSLRPAELAQRAGSSPNAVRRLLHTMLRDGQVRRVSYGKYRLAGDGYSPRNTPDGAKPPPVLANPGGITGGTGGTGDHATFATTPAPAPEHNGGNSGNASPDPTLLWPKTGDAGGNTPGMAALLAYVNVLRAARGVPCLPRVLPAAFMGPQECLGCGRRTTFRPSQPLVCVGCRGEAGDASATSIATPAGGAT